MMKAPETLPGLDSVQFAYMLIDGITDYADHMSPTYGRAFLAMQLLNGSVTMAEAIVYADQIRDE